jgi:hypothetical protein
LNNPYQSEDDDFDLLPYNRIQSKPTEGRTQTKRLEYRRGKRKVTFRAFLDDSVDVYVSCSDCPFALETQEDVTALFAFLGGIQETLICWLHDTSLRFVPPLHSWHLIRIDLNRDVPCSPELYFSMPKIALKEAEQVFRLYPKMLNDGKLYIRQETMISSSSSSSSSNGSSSSNLSLTENTIFELMANAITDPRLLASAAAAAPLPLPLSLPPAGAGGGGVGVVGAEEGEGGTTP